MNVRAPVSEVDTGAALSLLQILEAILAISRDDGLVRSQRGREGRERERRPRRARHGRLARGVRRVVAGRPGRRHGDGVPRLVRKMRKVIESTTSPEILSQRAEERTDVEVHQKVEGEGETMLPLLRSALL